MAINYPGPYEVEYEYVVQGQRHKLRVNCNVQGTPNVGTPTNQIQVYTKSGGTIALNTAIQSFWNIVRPWFHTSTTSSQPQVFRYDTGSFAKTWISQETTALGAGTSAIAVGLAAQTILTFRTGNGGLAKLTLLEGGGLGTARLPLVANPTGETRQRIAAYLISADSWILGRDDSFIVAPLYQLDGQNEALFRKRYRA